MTLEEELQVRHETADGVMALLDDLTETMAFYRLKAEKRLRNDLLDSSDISLLYDFLIAETRNVQDKIGLLTKMAKTAYLPLYKYMSYKKIDKEFKEFSDFAMRGGVPDRGTVMPLFLHRLVALRQAINTCYCSMKPDSKDFEPYFDKLKERYMADKEEYLEGYMDDVFDVRDAFRELRQEFKDNKVVGYWRGSGKNLQQTLFEMHKNDCIEQDLLPLVEYCVKYDLLQQRQEEEAVHEERTEDIKTINELHIHGNASFSSTGEMHIDKVIKNNGTIQ